MKTFWNPTLRKTEGSSLINMDFAQELDRCVATLAQVLARTAEDAVDSSVSQEIEGWYEDDMQSHGPTEEQNNAAPDYNHMQAVQGLSWEQGKYSTRLSAP